MPIASQICLRQRLQIRSGQQALRGLRLVGKVSNLLIYLGNVCSDGSDASTAWRPSAPNLRLVPSRAVSFSGGAAYDLPGDRAGWQLKFVTNTEVLRQSV